MAKSNNWVQMECSLGIAWLQSLNNLYGLSARFKKSQDWLPFSYYTAHNYGVKAFAVYLPNTTLSPWRIKAQNSKLMWNIRSYPWKVIYHFISDLSLSLCLSHDLRALSLQSPGREGFPRLRSWDSRVRYQLCELSMPMENMTSRMSELVYAKMSPY